jgi:hypothetical protein
VISVAMPMRLSSAAPSTLAMPLSTVITRSGWRAAASCATSGDSP